MKNDIVPKNEGSTLEPDVKKQPEPRKSILSIFGLGDFSPSRKPALVETSSTQESTNNSSSQSLGTKTKPLENISNGPKLLSIKFSGVKYLNPFST